VADHHSKLGEFIRRQRELQELSMRQLADLVGISNPYLSQIEHGLREPSERVLEAIAENLDVSADALRAQIRPRGDGDAEPAVVAAIKADRNLNARQRQALIDVYESFTGGPRSGRAAPS
jgi:transcriptional regulator with XRE-family HTH domain